MNFTEWASKTYAIYGSDEEQIAAQSAWEGALEEMRRTINAAYPTETSSAGLAAMLNVEIDGMLD